MIKNIKINKQMKALLKPLQVLYCIYAISLFLAIMLLIFPFVLLAALLGRIQGGNIILRLCTLWADIWFPLIFIFPRRIFEKPHNKQKQYVFVTNHISYIDSAVLVKVIRQPIRPLGKVEMAKIPLFGYIYKNAIVTVDRSNAANRAKSIRVLTSVIKKGISVFFFPEGTFNTTGQPLKAFYDGAFRLAIETQTPVKPVLFLDNYSRMHYDSVWSMTPGKCRVVFLDEIPVAGLTIADVAALKLKTHTMMSEKLAQYQAPWIKKNNEPKN
jgi:1-acyl-sn-glycerol-3-phosphate acyltransferase